MTLSAIRKSIQHWHQFRLLSLLVSVAMLMALLGLPANSAYAQQVSAARSTMAAAAASNVIGSVDTVSETAFGQIRVTGWAADPRTPNAVLQLHVYITGPNGQQGFAGNYTGSDRPDVARVLGWPGSRTGFDAVLPSDSIGDGSNSVCVYAISIAAPLTNPMLGCRTLTVARPAPKGVVDSIAVNGDSAVVTGWTFDPNHRDVSNQVHIYVNNAGVNRGAAFAADHPRPDVDSAYGITGRHGFSETVALGSGSNTIGVYGIGENNNNSMIGSAAVVQGPTTPNPVTGLPENVSAMWVNMWEGPVLGLLPANVVATNNLYILAIAQSATAGTGNLQFSHPLQSVSSMQTDIAGLKAKGNQVVLGIGGSSDGGITVNSAATASQFVASVSGLVGTYGFTGIDIDLEPSGSAWTQDALVSAVVQLKAKYGAKFLVGLTVGMYGDHTAKWLSLANALGNNYDYWAPMLYDFPEAHDSRLTAIVLDKVREAVAGGVPASKQILGFMCNSYYNTSTVPVTVNAYNAVRTEFPAIRGAFIWESSIEAAHNYNWSLTLGTQIRQGN